MGITPRSSIVMHLRRILVGLLVLLSLFRDSQACYFNRRTGRVIKYGRYKPNCNVGYSCEPLHNKFTDVWEAKCLKIADYDFQWEYQYQWKSEWKSEWKNEW